MPRARLLPLLLLALSGPLFAGRPQHLVVRRMTPEERALFEKRRRGRNIAIMLALLALTVIFYFVGMARILRG